MDMGVVKVVAFVVVTGALLAFSRRWLMDPKAHGFWRFLLFETDLVLILVNLESWFRNPFGPPQLVSWILLAASALLPVYGWATLRGRGRPKGHFENTRKLVTAGPYRHIRHPMYASLFYLAWGAFLKDVTAGSALLVVLATVFAVVLARVEEAEMRTKFGRAYEAYARTTNMFLPFPGIWGAGRAGKVEYHRRTSGTPRRLPRTGGLR